MMRMIWRKRTPTFSTVPSILTDLRQPKSSMSRGHEGRDKYRSISPHQKVKAALGLEAISDPFREL